ncbi:Adenylate cyclase, class 3 [Flavobacteriaceae bacterium MAR_2010_188]|nr:Adenylate cyclase, class 3 [Flavobacteriaceae bacterium MAR_2010_188]
MKSICFFLALVFSTGYFSYSQSNTEELLEKIYQSKPDSSKVILYNDLAGSLYRSSADSTILYADKAIELAEKVKYKKGLAYGYKNRGMAYYVKGEFNEVLKNWEKSLAIFEEINFKLGISNLQANIGAVYQSKGDDPTALDFFIKSIRNGQEIGDSLRIATAYVNIGTVYSNDKKTYPQALEAYQKAKTLFEALKDDDGRSVSVMNIAELYLLENKPKEALSYLEDYFASITEDGSDASTTLRLMGTAHMELGELEESEDLLRQSINVAQSKDYKMEETKARIKLGELLTEKNQYNEAVTNFDQALNLSKATQVLLDRRDAYEGLAELYSKMGDFEKAYNYQERFSKIRDTIRDDQYENTLGNLRFQYDVENKENEITLLNTENELKQSQIEKEATSRNLLLAVLVLFAFIIGGFFLQYQFVRRASKRIDKERARSENILLNILPKETAEELKQNGSIKAKKFERVTVLFTDFKAFSVVAEHISPENLVKSVDYYFKKFDEIVERNNLEKIKTIGDAYMCAGGLPAKNTTNAEDALGAAQEILAFVKATEANPPEDIYPFKVRIGLNTGPVIAGVVGTKKFQYDIWGNTVNIAARMESNSQPGKINVSENTYNVLKDKRKFQYRGEIEVKNSKKLKMYFLDDSSS